MAMISQTRLSISSLIIEIEALINELLENPSIELFNDFDDALVILTKHSVTLAENNLSVIEEHVNSVPVEARIHWHHALSILKFNMDSPEPSEEESSSEDCESDQVEADDEEEVAPAVQRTGWLGTAIEMSDLDKYMGQLRRFNIIGHLFRFSELMNMSKAGLKWVISQIVKFIRWITFADALDNFAIWVKENYSELKVIVMICTIIEIAVAIIGMTIFLLGLIIRPDKVIRKMIPDDVEEMIPGDS